MQVKLPNDRDVKAQAIAAGFSTVEDYVATLIDRYIAPATLACFAAFVSLAISGCNVSAPDPDNFLDQAFSRIEKTLTTPPESYGVEFTDICYLPAMSTFKKNGYFREGSGIYVSGERVQWRNLKYETERFESNPDSPTPYLSTVGVFTGPNQPYNSVSVLKGAPTFTKNSEPSFSLGLADIYSFSVDHAINLEHPNRSPFQILANPCLAPLKITPSLLRKWKIQQIQSQGDLRAYEAIGVHPDYPRRMASLRMYFSTVDGNALSRTEMTIRGAGGREEMREVRAVEKWQEVRDGVLVPQTFSYMQEANGIVQIRLIRTVTAASTNDVSEDRFDTAMIPEFQAKW